MKASNCDDCKYRGYGAQALTFICKIGHKPRFYEPKSPNDMAWGWKRKCGDFVLGSELGTDDSHVVIEGDA